MPSSEGADKANAVQRQKYGAGYSAEMSRRNKLRKTHGTGGYFRWLKDHDPEAFKQLIAKREARRKGGQASTREEKINR